MLNRNTVLCLMVVAVSTSAHAEDLNPPAGPVTPTGRFGPRTEINAANTQGDANSLFKITQPGSYYLGGNIKGVAMKHGIEIASSGVSLDLMGFELRGVVGSLSGISTDAAHDNLSVRNGTVTMWGSDGVDLIEGGSGFGSLIEGVHASGNGGIGIRSNQNGIIRACTAVSNASIGIQGSSNSVVESCAARSNGPQGIKGGIGAMIRGALPRKTLAPALPSAQRGLFRAARHT